MPKAKVKAKPVKKANNKRMFLGAPLSEWATLKMNFVNVLKKWPEKDIVVLEAAIRKLNGYMVGNLDFSISMPLKEVKEYIKDPMFANQADIAGIWKARLELNR